MSREPKEPKFNERRVSGNVPQPSGNSSANPQQQANRRRNRGSSDPADWAAVNASKLIAVICAITQHGYAVRFGYTKDGGAYAIGVIGDGEPYTEFVRPTEDLDLYFDGLLSDYGK